MNQTDVKTQMAVKTQMVVKNQDDVNSAAGSKKTKSPLKNTKFTLDIQSDLLDPINPYMLAGIVSGAYGPHWSELPHIFTHLEDSYIEDLGNARSKAAVILVQRINKKPNEENVNDNPENLPNSTTTPKPDDRNTKNKEEAQDGDNVTTVSDHSDHSLYEPVSSDELDTSDLSYKSALSQIQEEIKEIKVDWNWDDECEEVSDGDECFEDAKDRSSGSGKMFTYFQNHVQRQAEDENYD